MSAEPFEGHYQDLVCFVDFHLFGGLFELFALVAVPTVFFLQFFLVSKPLETVFEIDCGLVSLKQLSAEPLVVSLDESRQFQFTFALYHDRFERQVLNFGQLLSDY